MMFVPDAFMTVVEHDAQDVGDGHQGCCLTHAFGDEVGEGRIHHDTC